MSSTLQLKGRNIKIGLVIFMLLAGVFALGWIFTPAGIGGKLHAIAYAVCQQEPDHTLIVGGRLLPLCSRCTGMFLGALMAFIPLMNRRKARLAPSKGKIAVLLVFLLAFIVDGMNSLIAELWPAAMLYTPNNTLRLITGLGMGMAIANLLVPLWNQTYWADSGEEAALSSWKQFCLMLFLETAAAVFVLNAPGWSYYPIAILSTGMVPVLLTMIYTLLWMVILKKENIIKRGYEGIVYVEIGALCAWLQIGLFDLLRFTLTGTW